MDDLRGHMRRNLIWTTVQQWGVQAIRMAVLLILARLVKPQTFGVYALAGTIITISQLLFTQGMSGAITQRHEFEEKHLGAAFVSMFTGSLIAAVGLAAAAPLFARWLSVPDLPHVLRSLVTVLPLSVITTFQVAIWRRDLNLKRIAVATTTAQMIASAIGIGLALRGLGIWSLVGRQIAEAILMASFTVSSVPWKSLLRGTWKAYGEMIRFAAPIAGSNLLAMGRNRADELIIGGLLGPLALGFYALARREMEGITALSPAVIGNALLPIFSRVQRDPARVRAVMSRGIGLVGALTLPVFAGMGAGASLWVPLLLGKQWLPAVPVIEGFAIIAAVRSISGFNLTALQATGHPGKRLALEGITSTICLSVILVAVHYDIRVVVYASAIALTAILPFELFWVSHWIPLTVGEQLKALRLPAAGSVLLAGLIMILRSTGNPAHGAALRLGVATLAGLAVLLGCYRNLPPMVDPGSSVAGAA